MIYIDRHIWDFDLPQALGQVSAWRRDYALRYRHELDQRLCVAAYRLLQRALQRQYGIEELPRFIPGEGGKPLLEGHPDIHFSLSHCREAVACALGDSPVGIDVETYDHYSEDVAAHVMNVDELQQITAADVPAVAFTRLWTMKESFFKLSGGPLDGDVRTLLDHADDCRFTTIILDDFALTCCSRFSEKDG